jgi:transketolase
VAVEAAHPMSWHRWVGPDGAMVGIETFGASAPYQRIYQEYGITPEAVVARHSEAMAACSVTLPQPEYE